MDLLKCAPVSEWGRPVVYQLTHCEISGTSWWCSGNLKSCTDQFSPLLFRKRGLDSWIILTIEN